MQIGEVAKRVDVTIRTVRYYEEMGLIEPAMRTEGGFRLYDISVVRRLQLIHSLRSLDFPLKDIQELLKIRHDSHTGTVAAHRLIRLLQLQHERTNERIAQLLAIRADIEKAMALTAECAGCHLELVGQPCLTCGNVLDYAKNEHPETSIQRDQLEPLLPIAFQAML
jgi:DNA-binding transcriptional MerR regulator